MTTKSFINKCLAVAGQNGYDGVPITATNETEALSKLFAQILVGATKEECLKVYRNLKRQKLIQISREAPGSYRVTVTPAGAYRISGSSLNNLSLSKPDHWDQKWRMVSYDIPSPKSHERYVFVTQLKRLGFYMVQKSIWLHPYPSEDVITEISESLGIKRYILFAEVTKIDASTENKLRSKFARLE